MGAGTLELLIMFVAFAICGAVGIGVYIALKDKK